jgi:5-formyltetrahydrofolate cyclo-ligase
VRTDSDSATRKEALRRAVLEDLDRVDPEAASEAASQVASRLLAMPEIEGCRRILTCLSFGLEIDTWRLSERLLAGGHELYVPRTEGDRMTIHRYPCELETLPFVLAQPPKRVPAVADDRIDAVVGAALVLGLAFDRRGYRLGHGRGHFDRFLVGRPFPAIGLAYHRQLIDRVPDEPHDVPMALVVTEEEVVRCAPES